MNLQFVQDASLECPLRGVGAMHQHFPTPRGCLCLIHRTFDTVGHELHAPMVRDRRIWTPVRDDEDWDAVVIATPVTGLLRSSTSSQDRASRHVCIIQLPCRPTRSVAPISIKAPRMQTDEGVAAWILNIVVRASNEPVERD